MSASSDPDLLRRMVEFELSLQRDSSEIVKEFDWGVLIHNPETPGMWSGNYLEVRSNGLDAEALAALADEIQGPLEGIVHRDIVIADPDQAKRLAKGFEDLEGWDLVRNVYMVLAREPDREVGPAKEVEHPAVEPVRRAVDEAGPDFTQAVVEQRSVWDTRLERIGNGRWFAAPTDGLPGASCVLYGRGGTGQVETVGTLPERRGQGLASAVVIAAADASRERGDDLTFIVADADDWPWKLYERLGFDRVGEFCSFRRKPAQMRGEDSP